ncbi:hypothetical protein [Pontibacter chitinilyticus]|uniref:hypothetical protein n=1 Tax=Pontibacter chitinilyticus TaxID=2674989 RepID=UPI003219C67B
MVNRVLSYLHGFYGDNSFHNLTPLIKENPSLITENYIHNLHLDGFIEIQEPSAFQELKDINTIPPILGRLTEKGMYFLEGNQKAGAVIRAIENQNMLQLAYTDNDGDEKQVSLAPYIYGKDPQERPVVWGAVAGKSHEHRRFLLDDIRLSEEATTANTFKVNPEMQLSQPRDIEVVAQVNY